MRVLGTTASGVANETIPGAPQSFTATAASSTQINLSWSAPASNGGAAITSYTLKRGGTTIYTGPNTSFNDTGLSFATGYSYTVLATNSVGNGPTASASATTLVNVPSVPTSFSASAVSSTQINLSWGAPSSNGGGAVTSYTLIRNGSVIYTGAGTSFGDSGLSRVTGYSYTVAATNSAGTGATASASATTQGTVPGTPTIIDIYSTYSYYYTSYWALDVYYAWNVDNGGLPITNTQILTYAGGGAYLVSEHNTYSGATNAWFTINTSNSNTYPVGIRVANALGYGGWVYDYSRNWTFTPPPDPGPPDDGGGMPPPRDD